MTNTSMHLDKSSKSVAARDQTDASIKYGPGAPVVGSPVLFEAEASIEESSAEYEWEFGDGSTATGRTASNVFQGAGEQSVTLTVTDEDGETETVREALTVYYAPTVEVWEDDCEDGFVTVVIRGDSEFDPAQSVAVDSLRFGAPTALAMGSGASPVETDARDGDLRVQFRRTTPDSDDDSPGRLAGCTADGVPLAGTADAV